METIQTPNANRIIDWLIYGNRENMKKPLKSFGSQAERTKRFNEILKMK